ncbi:MAG: 50S ribosomal protein L25, partial [Myxococcota bacterium]
MPEIGKLSVELRTQTGKGPARRARARGVVPGVCYGRGTKPFTITVDPDALAEALDPSRGQNTLIEVSLGDGTTRKVLLRDVQKHPLSGLLLHADFMVVDEGTEVRVTVPVALTGKPEGVKLGGILHQAFHSLRVACRPTSIPAKFEVDVSSLLVGQAVHVSDVKFGEGVRPLADLREAIASVVAPKEEKTEVEATAAAATAAEAAAGAVPAAGAAPGAPGA